MLNVCVMIKRTEINRGTSLVMQCEKKIKCRHSGCRFNCKRMVAISLLRKSNDLCLSWCGS